MRPLDPVRQLEILKESYVSAQMVYELYPIGLNKAKLIIREIADELDTSKLLSQRPILVPIENVLDKYPINQKAIEKYVQNTK